MINKLAIFFSILSICFSSNAERHIRILWLGNSYVCDTKAGMPLHDAVKLMINTSHDSGLTDIVVDSSVVHCMWNLGLESHYEDSTSMSLLRSGTFTHVVLQGYILTKDTATMHISAQSTLHYAKLLADEVRKAGATPLIFCGQPRCDATPAMWDYVISAYEKAADSSNSFFVPASVSWRNALAENDSFKLYQTDCVHQNKNGIYLNAANFYCAFTGKSVIDNPVKALGWSYKADTLAFMQRIVWATYDSIQRARGTSSKPDVNRALGKRKSEITSNKSYLQFKMADNVVGGYVSIFNLDGRCVATIPVTSRVTRWYTTRHLSRTLFTFVIYDKNHSLKDQGTFVR